MNFFNQTAESCRSFRKAVFTDRDQDRGIACKVFAFGALFLSARSAFAARLRRGGGSGGFSSRSSTRNKSRSERRGQRFRLRGSGVERVGQRLDAPDFFCEVSL